MLTIYLIGCLISWAFVFTLWCMEKPITLTIKDIYVFVLCAAGSFLTLLFFLWYVIHKYEDIVIWRRK